MPCLGREEAIYIKFDFLGCYSHMHQRKICNIISNIIDICTVEINFSKQNNILYNYARYNLQLKHLRHVLPITPKNFFNSDSHDI